MYIKGLLHYYTKDTILDIRNRILNKKRQKKTTTLTDFRSSGLIQATENLKDNSWHCTPVSDKGNVKPSDSRAHSLRSCALLL